MIELEYAMTADEAAESTFNFLINRPMLKLLFFAMRASCILLCVGFAITIYSKSVRPEDIAAVLIALFWLTYYKNLNRWIIKRNFKSKNLTNLKRQVKFDHKSIFCRTEDFAPMNIEWKKLKYILQAKQGYIVPLTGISNAGKFIWLPYTCFKDANIEQQFIEHIKKFKIRLKKA